MKFIIPAEEELASLRADPLLEEPELDARPEVADGLKCVTGLRAGRVYWRSEHDHLYALELGDLGRGRPSTATVYGFWYRYQPRPPEHEIDADLVEFIAWVAEVTEGMEADDVRRVTGFAQQQVGRAQTSWPEDAVLRGRRTPSCALPTNVSPICPASPTSRIT